jgi:putative membrane protein
MGIMEGVISMHRIALCGFLLIGGIALAQDPPMSEKPPTGSKSQDRSTAKTVGQNNRSQNAADDKTFVMNAAMGGMAEVELGRLAVSKASSEHVKQFGQRMVDDHSKANDELKSVASQQKIDLPVSLDSKHQAAVDRLSKLSGSAFDKAYVKEMVKDHDEDVKEFQREAQSGQDSAVRAFASKTLPTLQEHQRMIHDMDKNGMHTTGTSDRSKK